MVKSSGPQRGRFSDDFFKGKEIASIVESIIRQKDTLDLQLRDGYFNVYFNGGNILRITEQKNGFGKFFDKFYLYDGTYNGQKVPKTYIEEQYSGKPREGWEKIKNYPTFDLAKEIVDNLDERQTRLMALLEAGEYDTYFAEISGIMETWINRQGREERRKQHVMACSNRGFTDKNNLVIIDIEFAVSSLKEYNVCKDKSKKKGKKVPKLDIIAVDRSGQIYCIELKDNLRADDPDSPQNVDNHLRDFNNTVGNRVETNDFPDEMARVVRIKRELGLLDPDVFVDTEKMPVFAVAYSGEKADDLATFRRNHSDIKNFVDVRVDSASRIYTNLTV